MKRHTFNTKDSLMLRFLYRTLPGRLILKLLIQPEFSQMAERFLSSSASRWLVLYYVRRYHICMDNIEVPAGGFPSFNAFFTRKKKLESGDMTYGHLVSPCDGLLSVIKIMNSTVFDIKHTEFTLEDLLRDKELANRFQDGVLLIFRLTPQHYHRYGYAVDGKVLRARKVRGKLHCVRPIALRTVPVFAQNNREYEVISAGKFGIVIQMEVGALLVGKINNYRGKTDKPRVCAGDEKGYFAFGGSTIVVVLQKDSIVLNKALYDRQISNGEIPVRKGEFIASVS